MTETFKRVREYIEMAGRFFAGAGSKKEADEAVAFLDAMKAQIDSYALDIKMLHEQANSASVMLRVAKEEHDATRRNYDADIKANNAENAALRAQVATLTHRVQSLETERDHLTEQVAAANKDVERLTKERNNYLGIIELGLEIEQGLREEKSDHIKSRATTLQRIARLAHDNARHLETIRALQAGLDDALSVALDCQQRWSRGHPDRVDRARAALDASREYKQADDVKPAIPLPWCSGCGRHATVIDERNGATRCTDYPRCNFKNRDDVKGGG